METGTSPEVNTSLKRLIRILGSSDEQSITSLPKPFSDFLNTPNIILLGDPGSGKTHTFKAGAKRESAEVLPVRSFLTNGRSRCIGKRVLYIDGLDEIRSRVDNANLIDQIIILLNELGRPNVRLSCRAADWLGETDLSLFKDYFGKNSYVVFQLEPLTEMEIADILRAKGITKPEMFIQKAFEHNVDSLLSNPQTLLMLTEIAGDNSWPNTKKELFELSASKLLSEHNQNIMRTSLGKYGPDELIAYAGAACGAILISNASGISLRPHNMPGDFPSYRTLPVDDLEKAQACLTRRAFSFVDADNEAVSYAHRTIAEFLAATWFKKKIQNGFPFGRIQNLICIKGHPATELRGLHAWLATMLSDSHSAILIKNDPFGVLMYGDPASLSPSNRKKLFHALEELPQTDPWFRSKDWSDKPLGALSGPDMVESFRQVLSDKNFSYHLRSLVMDAISNGPQLSMSEDLGRVLSDTDEPFGIRSSAVEALLHAVPNGKQIIAEIFKSLLTNDPSVRLRAKIIARLYNNYFTPEDVLSLLNDVLKDKGEFELGSFRWFADSLPCESLPGILDGICHLPNKEKIIRNNRFEVEIVLSRLLIRFLQSGQTEETKRIWLWLTSFFEFCRHSYGGVGRDIGSCLSEKPQLILAFFEIALNEFNIEEPSQYFIYKFKNITMYSLSNRIFIEYIFSILKNKDRFAAKDYFLYELLGILIFESIDLFEEYYNFANGNERLEKIRDKNCFHILEDWRIKNIQEKWQNERENETKTKQIMSDLSEDQESIRSGQHLNALGWLAYLYFGLFIDSKKELSPMERLQSRIGEEMSAIAIEGFSAVLSRNDLPTPTEVALHNVKNRFYRWWYAVIAGMNKEWQKMSDITRLSDEVLKSALAISSIYLFDSNENNDQASKWQEKIFLERPTLAKSVFEDIIRVELKHSKRNSSIFYKLASKETQSWRGDLAMNVLAELPNANPDDLRDLLFAAISDSKYHRDLLKLCSTIISARGRVKKEQRALWLATGFLLDNSYFQPLLKNYLKSNSKGLWVLKNIVESAYIDNSKKYQLTVPHHEFLIESFGKHYKNVSASGDWTKEKDAAEFVRSKINALSTLTQQEALESLNRLLHNDGLSSYHDHVKHAISNQASRRREAEFEQPSWTQIIEALNGGKPANMADFYALTLAHLETINSEIRFSNTDKYKAFWNCDSHGRVKTPQIEDVCRDRLIDFLRPYFLPIGIRVEPEGHMAEDKRSDIILQTSEFKLPLELKRDYHEELWYACNTQLERLYTRDPESKDYGIYVVFWFGEKRPKKIPKPPKGIDQPKSAEELEKALQSLIPTNKAHCLKAVVIDVTPASTTNKE
ncbi:MAG: hypothetical protein HY956_00790 [Deltaproteobacteria bacterium]|nr:hypothetical protein [Deltaproteobacteria bacterium]